MAIEGFSPVRAVTFVDFVATDEATQPSRLRTVRWSLKGVLLKGADKSKWRLESAILFPHVVSILYNILSADGQTVRQDLTSSKRDTETLGQTQMRDRPPPWSSSSPIPSTQDPGFRRE
jgi:hypothetical protein